MKTTRLDPGQPTRKLERSVDVEVSRQKPVEQQAPTGEPPRAPGSGAAGVSAAARKTIGDLEPNRPLGGAGAAAALRGLDVVEKKPSRWRAGVVAALIGLTLVNAVPQTARADTLAPSAPATTSEALPFTTGPPAGTSSLLTTRIDQLTTVAPSIATGQVGSELSDAAIDAQTRAALDRFQTRVEQVLQLGAASAASGAAFDPDRPLTAAQNEQVKDALVTLVSELPVGALSPELAEVAKDALRARGLSTAGVEARPLKDLGKIAGQVVKDMLRDWEDEHQTASKALRTLWIGGALASGYVNGSDAMKSIGVEPEVRFKLLDGKVRARLGGEWEAKLANPAMYLALSSRFPVQLGDSRLNAEVGARVEAAGPSFGQLAASGFRLTGSLSGTLQDGASVALHGDAKLDGGGALESATVNGSWSKAPYTVGAGATYFAQTDRFVGSLSVGYKPSNDVEVFVQGSHDSRGDSAVGVGVRLRF